MEGEALPYLYSLSHIAFRALGKVFGLCYNRRVPKRAKHACRPFCHRHQVVVGKEVIHRSRAIIPAMQILLGWRFKIKEEDSHAKIAISDVARARAGRSAPRGLWRRSNRRHGGDERPGGAGDG